MNWAEKVHESRNSPALTPATPASQVFCQAKIRQILSAEPVLSSLRKSNVTVHCFFSWPQPNTKVDPHTVRQRDAHVHVHTYILQVATQSAPSPNRPTFPPHSSMLPRYGVHRRKTPITTPTNYDRWNWLYEHLSKQQQCRVVSLSTFYSANSTRLQRLRREYKIDPSGNYCQQVHRVSQVFCSGGRRFI